MRYLILFFLVTIISCKNESPSQENTVPEENIAQEVLPVEAPERQIKITYQGPMPCQGCETNISTLKLYEDGSWFLSQKDFLQKEMINENRGEGIYNMVDNDIMLLEDGNIILWFADRGDGSIIMRDLNGQPIETDVILEKIPN